jgi:transcriptional regulator with XRE-family HTH domain
MTKMARAEVTQQPFAEELPRLLRERRTTLRALAREIGGVDHSYLSRMINGKTRVNPLHAQRIARHLGLPADYFPEVREAAIIDAVRENAQLRELIYFEQVKGR